MAHTTDMSHPEFWFQVTFRKAQVLRGLTEHRSIPEIADRLGVEPTTISGAVESLKAITLCHSVGELARWWIEHRATWYAWVGEQAGCAG